jgi:hypothetical protein
VRLEGCDLEQETDTHWRAKKGKGSWNYRLKFPVELGPRSRAMKFPYLFLQVGQASMHAYSLPTMIMLMPVSSYALHQMWDRDLAKWNDCICEGTCIEWPCIFRESA